MEKSRLMTQLRKSDASYELNFEEALQKQTDILKVSAVHMSL